MSVIKRRVREGTVEEVGSTWRAINASGGVAVIKEKANEEALDCRKRHYAWGETTLAGLDFGILPGEK